jgi:hypothetical protein
MNPTHQLNVLPDDQLLQRLSELLHISRRLESELIAHIGEVDARRLYARQASSSMFSYCTDVLHLSEAEAYLRIGVARAARQYPVLLDMLADGRLHLSGIARLVPHLSDANHEVLLKRAAYKSKRQIDELIAEIAPKPDVPLSIRKLPDRREKSVVTNGTQLRPDGVERTESDSAVRTVGCIDQQTGAAKAPYKAPEPLSPARYKIQFTVSAEFRDKLERLRRLLRASIPDGDLAAVLEMAVTEKLDRRARWTAGEKSGLTQHYYFSPSPALLTKCKYTGSRPTPALMEFQSEETCTPTRRHLVDGAHLNDGVREKEHCEAAGDGGRTQQHTGRHGKLVWTTLPRSPGCERRNL